MDLDSSNVELIMVTNITTRHVIHADISIPLSDVDDFIQQMIVHQPNSQYHIYLFNDETIYLAVRNDDVCHKQQACVDDIRDMIYFLHDDLEYEEINELFRNAIKKIRDRLSPKYWIDDDRVDAFFENMSQQCISDIRETIIRNIRRPSNESIDSETMQQLFQTGGIGGLERNKFLIHLGIVCSVFGLVPNIIPVIGWIVGGGGDLCCLLTAILTFDSKNVFYSVLDIVSCIIGAIPVVGDLLGSSGSIFAGLRKLKKVKMLRSHKRPKRRRHKRSPR